MLPILLTNTMLSALVQPQLRLTTPAVSSPRLPSFGRTPIQMAADDDICVDEICIPIDDDDDDFKENQPWYRKGSNYAEESRQYRRTVYMHDEWVKHRSSERFIKNFETIGRSGVSQSLKTELSFVTGTAAFTVLANMLITGYQDLSGVVHEAPLAFLAKDLGSISLPALPFSICMPALSLLLVFRTNTGYARWNEARTLWGGVINNCRNVVRQANTFFKDDPIGESGKDRIAANTAAFAKALRNFLRGPDDDKTLRSELYELASADLITAEQVEACMAAKNRPMFCISAMSANLREADLEPMDRARIDQTISTLVDLTGACERIFKSPVPLVYTRHTSRFLTAFLIFLPFGLWPVMGGSWNHWATVPASDVIAFFLLGIEEIGIQIEEPFSVLPLEAFCNGAIAATMDEMLVAKRAKAFDYFKSPEEAAARELAGTK